MKIIFVNRFYAPDHSATSQMLTDLATALAMDNQVHVVTSRQRYGDPAALLAPYELIHGVLVDRVYTTTFGRTSLPGRALDYLSFYIAASVRLLRLARRGDVIVAKTDPPLISVPAGWVARIRGARLVNWLQDIFPEVAAELHVKVARGPGGWLLRSLRNRSLRGSAANVVLGRLMRERVQALGVEPESVVVIPNWADGAALQPTPTGENKLRAEWELGDKFVVCYSGNFGRVHEFQTLLGAAGALRAQAEIVFLLIGDGAQMAAVSSSALDEKLSNIVLKPYQPRQKLGQSLGAADVHVVTLRPELEGLVVPSKFYGIAAVGRPTIFIGEPDGEIGAIVREAGCGLCVREGDVEGLVTAIMTLRDDPLTRKHMGRNARRVFDERFDKRVAVKAWRALLDSVAHGS
jgi:colanic acid biosynthesis glycosyl transferase WcaI